MRTYLLLWNFLLYTGDDHFQVTIGVAHTVAGHVHGRSSDDCINQSGFVFLSVVRVAGACFHACS